MAKHKHNDPEFGYVGSSGNMLYPYMIESPPAALLDLHTQSLRDILGMQLLLTIAVAFTVMFVHPITRFIAKTRASLVLCIVLLSFLSYKALDAFGNFSGDHSVIAAVYVPQEASGEFPFTGIVHRRGWPSQLACPALTPKITGRVVLEAVILTAVVVVGLTLYTFWAARRGKNFSLLGSFLFAALLMLMVFGIIQMFFSLEKTMIYGALSTLIFSGYIIYDTDELIKRHSYEDYIWAAVSLYIDIINLFLSLIAILRMTE